jgi:pimeloyl-ACP methyl ester carboxylesterase
MWKEQAFGLGDRFRIVAPDLRGYGESSQGGESTHLGEFAEDLGGLLDYLRIPHAAVIGLSMGGQIALEFYHLFPRRVRALILADTFAQADTDEGRERRYAMAARLLQEGMNAYAEEVLPKMITPANV